jgi:helix-turn-helix protein
MTDQNHNSEQPDTPKTPYTVKNIKYGEKTVRGRVIGRAKTVIPEEQVLELARLHCTNQEMADFFEVKLQTFMDNFRDIITKGRLETKQRLRAAQLKVALDGNTTMLIFLGKNYLNQSDQPINTSEEKILPWLEESGTS